MDDRRIEKSAESDTAHRHGGGIVPAFPGSSSDEGLPRDLRAGSLGAMATALIKRTESLERVLARSKALSEDERYPAEKFQSAREARCRLDEIVVEIPWSELERGLEFIRNMEILMNSATMYEAFVYELEKNVQRFDRASKAIVREIRSFVDAVSKMEAKTAAREVLFSRSTEEVGIQAGAVERCDASSQTRPVEVEKMRGSLAPASDGISRPAVGGDDTPAEAMEIVEEGEVLIPSPKTSGDSRVSASRGASALFPRDWERIGDLVSREVRRVLGDSSLRRPSPPFILGEKEGVSWATVVSSGDPIRPSKRKKRKVAGGGSGDAVDTSSPLLWTRGWERHLLRK